MSLTNDSTMSHCPDETDDSIMDSSFDNEFFMDQVAQNVDTTSGIAQRTVQVSSFNS